MSSPRSGLPARLRRCPDRPSDHERDGATRAGSRSSTSDRRTARSRSAARTFRSSRCTHGSGCTSNRIRCASPIPIPRTSRRPWPSWRRRAGSSASRRRRSRSSRPSCRHRRSGLRYGFKGSFTTDRPTVIWIYANWTSPSELRGVVRHEAAHLAFARTHTRRGIGGSFGAVGGFRAGIRGGSRSIGDVIDDGAEARMVDGVAPGHHSRATRLALPLRLCHDASTGEVAGATGGVPRHGVPCVSGRPTRAECQWRDRPRP